MVKDHNMSLASMKVMMMESAWKRWRTLTRMTFGGDAHGPGEPSALRALHGDDGEPMVVPTNLVGWESRCFSTAQTTQAADAGATPW